jgi:hypothetical protein
MKKILFHVGPPKSATTTLQNRLWHAANLKTLNAYFPLDVDCHITARFLVDQNPLFFSAFSELLSEFESSNYNVFVYSSEILSALGYLDFYDYNNEHDFYSNFRRMICGYDIDLVYTLPLNTKSRLYSTICETIKHGTCFSVSPISEILLNSPYFNARKLFENVSRVFKPGMTHVLRYNDLVDIFEYLDYKFNIKLSKCEVPFLNKRPDNISLYLMHAINQLSNNYNQADDVKLIPKLYVEILELSKKINSISQDVSLSISDFDNLFSLLDVGYIDNKEILDKLVNDFDSNVDVFVNRYDVCTNT